MFIKVVALVIGILVAAAGMVYYVKEKQDPESRKIYMVTTVIGVVIAVVSAVLLFL